MAIMADQVTQPLTISESSSNIEQNEKDNSQDSDEQIYVLQNLAINSFSTITIHQEFYQIREIILDEVADPQPVQVLDGLREDNYFRTLFRQVISPNAP